jgi:hypothetical protein
MNEELCLNDDSIVNYMLTTSRDGKITCYNYDISNNIDKDIKDLKKRNAELQTMVNELVVKDRKRQEEFENIINMIKTNIKKNE